MTLFDKIYLYVISKWMDIKDFFTYTIWGKKTPLQKLQEHDPYIYEDDE